MEGCRSVDVLRDGVHRLAVRVYYADTDFSGVVMAIILSFWNAGAPNFSGLPMSIMMNWRLEITVKC